MPDIVYQDTTNKDLASLQITPTWFDSSSVRGNSNIQIAIFMLEGIQPDEVLYQDVPFVNKALYEGRTVAVLAVVRGQSDASPIAWASRSLNAG